jgi:hypothetical protein
MYICGEDKWILLTVSRAQAMRLCRYREYKRGEDGGELVQYNLIMEKLQNSDCLVQIDGERKSGGGR